MHSKNKTVNVTKIRFHMMESVLLHHTFTPLEGYHDSKWAVWEKRIKDGHRSEEKSISRQLEKWKASAEKGNSHYDPSAWIEDDYWQTSHITNAMYAALVVAIWADMEEMLKGVAGTCIFALKRKDEVPYQFDKIQRFFMKEFSLEFSNLAGYEMVNAIRILNNSFKHSDGRYRPDKSKPHSLVPPDLAVEWKLEESSAIEYSKLPVGGMVSACYEFCTELMERVQSYGRIKVLM